MTGRDQRERVTMLWFVTILTLCIIALLCRGVRADAPSTRSELADTLTRVAIHEGALTSTPDLLLVYQCAQSHGDTAGQQLWWLRAHSPHATGRKPAFSWDANSWTAGFDFRTRPISVDADWFRNKTLPRARELRELAHRLVDGERYERPCAEEPSTWGRKADGAKARAFGLRPLRCAGTSNDGYAAMRKARRI